MKRKAMSITIFSLLAIWLIVIWCFSMQTGDASTGVSYSLAERVLEGREVAGNRTFVLWFEYILRKTAHFSEFAVLGLLSALAFQLAGGRHPVYKGHALCMAVAIMDEVHQLFVPGRTGQLNDVAIDVFGACAGLFLFALVRCAYRRRMALKREKQAGRDD